MKFTVLAVSTLLTSALASSPTLLNKRDKFNKCTVFGSNCATQDQRFCDADTGHISVCHRFGDECWVRYTMDPCSSKREAAPEPAPEPVPEVAAAVQERDEFNDCSVFGADCAVDGNVFCKDGIMRKCYQIGWGSGQCWVRYLSETC